MYELVGRSDTLFHLRALCDQHPAVAVVGPPGVGKTLLARAALQDAPHTFVDLTGVCTLPDVLAAVATALALPTQGLATPQGAAHALALSPLPVLLDNAEDATEAVALLVATAVEAGARRLLLTSREAPPLAPEAVLSLGPLAPQDAAVLLTERARRLAPRLRLPHDADLDALVHQLDGLPLALELAAPRLALFTPARLLADLRTDAVLSDPEGRTQRHTSLDALVTSAWVRLSPTARDALLALARFRHPVDADAVTAVMGEDATPGLLELLRSSLVIPEHDADAGVPTRRLRAFATVAAFARRQPLAEEVALRHARWTARTTADLATRLRLAHGAEALDRGRRLMPDLALAVQTLLRHDPAEAARAVADTIALAEAALPLGELRGWIGQVLAPDLDPHVVGPLAVRAAVARAWVGDVDGALVELAQIRPVLTTDADRVWADFQRARLLELAHRLDEAVAAAHDAAAGAASLPNAQRAAAYRVHGGILRGSGHRHDAEQALLRGRDAAREAHDVWEEGMVLCELASLVGVHDLPAAEAHLDHALALDDVLGGHLGYRGIVLANAATLLAECAPARAAAALREATDLAGRSGRVLVVTYLDALGAVAQLLRGEPRAAAEAALEVQCDTTRRAAHGYAHRNVLVAWCAIPLLYDDPDAACTRIARELPGADAAVRPWLDALDAIAQARSGRPRALPTPPGAEPVLDVVAAVLAAALGQPADVDAARAALPRWPDQLTQVVLRALTPLDASVVTSRRLSIDAEGDWFELDGRRVALGRRVAARGILLALTHAHLAAPGETVDGDRLFSSGWPGTQIHPDSARQRLHTTVRDLRRLGLGDAVQTMDGGYRIDPRLNVDLVQ